MVQFPNMGEPDLNSVYTTDYNARSQYVQTLFNVLYPNVVFTKNYFAIYLNF
ncbi:MAG: hypothetical protein H7296_02940 [Bacteroidia bacterium]|nr:hypothetical protein [Bacteroidia bacterium]